MSTYSEEHKLYLKKRKKRKMIVVLSQIIIIVLFLGIWELLARTGKINTFLSSSPSNVLSTFVSLFQQNHLLNHIYVTVYETLLSFLIASGLSLVIASILWWYPLLADIFDPYLTILNSLPKVALGPLIIIWVGANTNSIIFMALMICLIISIINIYHGFMNTEKNYITLMRSFHASKFQIYKGVVLRSNVSTIINCLKINISMSLIGITTYMGRTLYNFNLFYNRFLFHYN